jgi:proline iminopeptidase
MKLIFKRMVLLTVLAAYTFTGCDKELNLNDPGNLVPKTVTEDLLLPAITINGTKLHAESFGNPNDPMVVNLHGGPGGDYLSMLNCKALVNDGYFVVFYDQRGAGLSQRHDKSIYSIQLMLDDLTGVIKYYRKSVSQKIFLLGHSWGAMLATAYVNAYPSAIRGLILAEPGGFTWDETKDYIKRTREIKPFNEATNDVFFSDQILTGKENEHQILDYKMAVTSAFDNIKGNVQGNAAQDPFWRMGAVTSTAYFKIADKDGFNWTTNLSRFTTKVLFCYSELNKAYGLDHAKLLSSAYPNVQLEKINGSGHGIIFRME